MNSKFRKFLFSIFGISSWFLVIFMIFMSVKFYNDLIGNRHCPLVLEVVMYMFITAACSFLLIIPNIFSDSKITPFTISPIFLWKNRKCKWVYHVELGHYMMSVRGGEIYLYQCNVFYHKLIFRMDSVDDIDIVSQRIKSRLDDIYKNKLEDIKKEKKIKSSIDNLMKWDGYLDKQGRRDGKIKEILGK